MKLMAAGDIHGSRKYCKKLLDAFILEGADQLLLLGDLLSHHHAEAFCPGDAFNVPDLLNRHKDKIICVRGNGDWESDQAQLEFPILDDYRLLRLGSLTVFATHGHRYWETHLPPIPIDILLHGHTHVPAYRRHKDFLYLNPGAVSGSRGGSKQGYMILQERHYLWKDIDGGFLCEYSYEE